MQPILVKIGCGITCGKGTKFCLFASTCVVALTTPSHYCESVMTSSWLYYYSNVRRPIMFLFASTRWDAIKQTAMLPALAFRRKQV